MAAVLNAQLTAMLTALDGVVVGLGNEFVAHVGSTMARTLLRPVGNSKTAFCIVVTT